MTAPEVKVTFTRQQIEAASDLANEICGCATREQHKRDVEAVLTYRATATAPLEARIALLEAALGEAVGALEHYGKMLSDNRYDMGEFIEEFANVARTTLANLSAMLDAAAPETLKEK